MAPNERGEVGDVFVADLHAVSSQLLDGRLHVDSVPVDDGIEGKPEAAKLFFLPLPKRASDFAALAVVDTPAEAVTQFGVIELSQDAPAERGVVNVASAEQTTAGFPSPPPLGFVYWKIYYATKPKCLNTIRSAILTSRSDCSRIRKIASSLHGLCLTAAPIL